MTEEDMRTKFTNHRSKAKHRGIEFKLTFNDWKLIWLTSGKWEQRGIRKGQYVMSRVNDVGPYAIGNVFIQTSGGNNTDAHSGNQYRKNIPNSESQKKKISESLSGIEKEKVQCPHCSKTGGKPAMTRFHFNNCKLQLPTKGEILWLMS
jgi:hypothetical protein